MKRPRAPIACFRCHRKKVRCDGAHPFCTRCQSTGSSCSYPSSRRSRNTQPHHVDPYIDHLSQLEHQIRQIEVDMNDYRSMLLSSFMSTSTDIDSTAISTSPNGHPQEDMLRSHLSKTEQEVQESRTILAQLRLRGEQRIARTKRNQTKEAKQRQQQRSSSSPTNNKKKPATSSPKVRKNETTPNETSATKSATHKPGTKSSSSLQHMPTTFFDLYEPSSGSYQNMYSHHQHTSSGGYPMPPPPSQQPPADLYYMSMVSPTTTGTTHTDYYDPLMDYPWTTPTDFAATGLKDSSAEKEKTEQTHQGSAHYSPSTVAAIEQVTRMAQQQMNHQHP